MKQSKRRAYARVFRGSLVLAVAGLLWTSLQQPAQALPPPGYTLTWSDEFNGAVGSSPNSANWNFDLGAGGWGNGELETYVSDTAHCAIISDPAATDGLALQITATDVGGVYESARLDSIGHQNPTFGYIEIRAKNPIGQGIWPAFWMLGTDFPDDSWPNCGEQDIMEQFESAPGTNMASWHMNYLGNEDDWSSPYTLANGATFNQAYHTFGLLWTQTSVNAYVDGVLYETHASQSPGWVFNHPYYYLLNLAIGGGPPGNPNASTVFPQNLDVDYIRYYSPPAYMSPGAGTITDPCNDLSMVYNTSGNWIVDDSNPTYFNGDTGRLSRIYNATEFLNYKYPNISAATVTVGTGSANPTAVTLWYSTNNGSTYTAATNTYSAITATTAGWGMYTVSTSGLPAGVTDLEIQEAPTTNSWDHQIANVVITSAAATIPAAPVALGAISGSNAVYLSWLGSNGGSTYNIYRSTTSGGEGTTPFVTGNVGTTYGDLTVANGVTYYYKVAAVNSAGTSGQSGEMVANPTGTSTAPGAPTALTATAGNAQVALAWTASSGATSYNVYRGTTSGGESTTAIATGVTGTSYTNTGLTNGTTYFYTVAAVSAGGTSTASNEASATPTAGTAPSAPTGLAAAGGTAQITVTWAASSGATAYNIYRGTTSGSEGTTVFASVGNVTTYTNTGLGNGATYFYKVAAVNSVGTSAQSAEVSATTSNTPPAPTGVAAAAGNSQATVTWTASSGATAYNIYRSTTSGGEGTTVYAALGNVTTYTNTGLTNGTAYYYTVAAVNSVGTSAQSTQVSATPTAGAEGPYGGTPAAIPGTVQAENYDTGGQGVGYNVTSVNGSDNGYRSDGVDLEVCTDTGGGVDVGWTAAGQWFRYTVNVATAGTYTAAFRVAADTAAGTFHLQNSAGTNLSGSITAPVTGGWQTWTTVNATVTLPAGQQVLTISQDSANFNINYVTFTLTSPPAAPTGVTATPGNAQVALAWSASSSATSYNVYRGTTAGGESATAIATGITSTSYTNTGLTNGTTYYYKVAAVSSVGTSAQSAEVSATPSAGGTSGSVSIDCGGAAASPFVADVDFSGGTTGSTTAAINTSILSNPAPAQTVLQTYRQGASTYTLGGFTAGSGHVVSLYFVEPTYTAAGQRTFNVLINGTTVLSGFDIYGNTGAQNKGIQENFNATANASGQVVIAFTAVTNSPIIQAIVCN